MKDVQEATKDDNGLTTAELQGILDNSSHQELISNYLEANPLVVGDHAVDVDFDDGWFSNSFDIKITGGDHHDLTSIKGDIKTGPPNHQYSLNREITLWDEIIFGTKGA